MNPKKTSRRRFLAAAGAAPIVLAANSVNLLADPQNTSNKSLITKSQSLPQPKIVFPTDSLPQPTGRKKRIAAVTTAYFRYSHADDIITKFIEGYSIVGRTHVPHCDVVSLYVEQMPANDIGRGMAARYNIPMFDTPQKALTLGGDQLAVDGVLLIGEHGDYPKNEKGQQLYPRRRLFGNLVEVFRHSKRSVPVYNDKHFSYSWEKAKWMYDRSHELGFAMMAGSSVPVAWRRPALAFKPGIEFDAALSVGFAGIESYGYHTLELLQTVAEKRRGGEVGIKAVETLSGNATWQAAKEGRWRTDLLEAAIASAPSPNGPLPADQSHPRGLENLRRADPNAVVFLVHYSDGFSAAAYVSRGLITEFCFAAAVRGQKQPLGTWCQLNKPQRDHFSFLCNHIEVMFRSGKPSYPVQRTYLVTGALEALIDSYVAGGKRVETPHLATIGYTPVEDL